jgi:hypothetical protein
VSAETALFLIGVLSGLSLGWALFSPWPRTFKRSRTGEQPGAREFFEVLLDVENKSRFIPQDMWCDLKGKYVGRYNTVSFTMAAKGVGSNVQEPTR